MLLFSRPDHPRLSETHSQNHTTDPPHQRNRVATSGRCRNRRRWANDRPISAGPRYGEAGARRRCGGEPRCAAARRAASARARRRPDALADACAGAAAAGPDGRPDRGRAGTGGGERRGHGGQRQFWLYAAAVWLEAATGARGSRAIAGSTDARACVLAADLTPPLPVSRLRTCWEGHRSAEVLQTCSAARRSPPPPRRPGPSHR